MIIEFEYVQPHKLIWMLTNYLLNNYSTFCQHNCPHTWYIKTCRISFYLRWNQRNTKIHRYITSFLWNVHEFEDNENKLVVNFIIDYTVYIKIQYKYNRECWPNIDPIVDSKLSHSFQIVSAPIHKMLNEIFTKIYKMGWRWE